MPTFPTSVDTVALARRLNSSNDAERQQAQADLQALIADDARRIRQCRALQIYSSMTAILLYLAFFVYERISGHHPVNDLAVLGAITAIIMGYYAQTRAKEAIRNIDALGIPQTVGVLLEVYGANGRFILGDTRPTLTRLLPRLQATDASLLTPGQRKLLYTILSSSDRYPWYKSYWSADLKIAILSALEQIGDEKAVPHVAKLARTARNPQVRVAAQECLPFLQQRAEQTRIEQTLLRASMSTDSPDMLLRPTIAVAPTEPQQLLRASNAEAETQKP